jgi:hypothetical protein
MLPAEKEGLLHRTSVLVAAMTAALVVLTAACGGSGSPFDSSTAAGDGSATTSGGATTSQATAGSLPGDASEIQVLLDRFRDTPLRLTYLVGEEPNRQEITLSQDPTADPPASAVIFQGGQWITLGDRSILCGAGAGNQCFEMEASGGFDMASAMINPYAMLALSLEGITDTPGFEVDTSGTTIAGRTGVCFTFSPQAILVSDVDSVRDCIDDQLGFTLLLEVTPAGSATATRQMELQSVGQPQPGDFEPTGTVISVPQS